MRFPVDLVPLGVRLELEAGASLEAALAPHGVEFPCGAAGRCRGCRVRVLQGDLAVTPEMRAAFTPAELTAGWRLACRARVESPITLEVAQWETPVLSDDAALPFEPADGIGIAIDLGATTLAAQSVDLATGAVIGVETALNPQAAWGADVMSRIQFALDSGAAPLTAAIRETLGAMIARLPHGPAARLVLLAGNTAMHHLFCGRSVEPLAHAPFHPTEAGEARFSPADLNWNLPASAEIRFLPCLGGFVGSDVLAGILATGIAEEHALAALIDLGTNGEIVVGCRGRLLCASTAAGPAFEAGRIRMGMRASTGAISHCAIRDGRIECRVIGAAAPRGICGSGLVDAAAAGLDLGAILPSGRLAAGAREWTLVPPVALAQSDIRELQLAKGAVAAALELLLGKAHPAGRTPWSARSPLAPPQPPETAPNPDAPPAPAQVPALSTLHLAGAFGNYMNADSACRIGLLPRGPRIVPAGNASLRGVKMALLAASRRDSAIAAIQAATAHIPLAELPQFADTFAAHMSF
jgi:uncharacterized 2Fe-2S/4Fe-4S cluster protein (DUF4445 family)